MSRTLLVVIALALLPHAASGTADVPCSDDILGRACPDLVVDALDAGAPTLSTETFASTHCAVIEGLVAPGERTLLRFPLATANIGRRPVVLGNPYDHPEWYTDSPCHGHKHFDGFAEYRLWTPAAYAEWTLVRAQDPRPAAAVLGDHPELADDLVHGRKQGFCLMDSAPIVPMRVPPGFPTCGYQGLSVGWEDRYESTLDGQWIDVTGVPPGDHVLELEVNPERRIEETEYAHNTMVQYVFID